VYAYMGTSLIRNRPTLAPYSRFMGRDLWWSRGGGRFLMSEVPLYVHMNVMPLTKMVRQFIVRGVDSEQTADPICEDALYRNVQWFRGGLVFEARRLLYHSA